MNLNYDCFSNDNVIRVIVTQEVAGPMAVDIPAAVDGTTAAGNQNENRSEILTNRTNSLCKSDNNKKRKLDL